MKENLFHAAWDYFEQKKWPHVAAEEGRIIQTLLPPGPSPYNGYLHVLADRRQFVFYSVFPRHVPRGKISAVQELVTRANYDLIWGNFELNLDHGGLRFKTSLTLGEAPFDPELLQPLVVGNVSGLFRFHPSIDALIDTTSSVEKALRLAT